jgi:hypothetical protein
MNRLLGVLLFCVFAIQSIAADEVVSVPKVVNHMQADLKSGLEIVSEYKLRDSGFLSLSVDMKMELINARGQTSVRFLRSRALEPDDGVVSEKRLLIFDKPLDVKGTVLLTSSYIDRADDQWLYLPAVKRVKRITSNNKTGPFVGSEFSYEDLSAFSVNKYDYKFLKTSECGISESCFEIERIPKEADTGYTRQIIWIDRDKYRLWKVEYYDRKNQLLKVLDLNDYEKHLDRFWRAGLMTMTNVQTSKKTILTWSDYQFGINDRAQDFNPNQISKIR